MEWWSDGVVEWSSGGVKGEAIFRRCLLALNRPTLPESMRSRFGIFFGALALLQILGGHWAVLQTTAWVGMIVQYSQRDGFTAGLAQTFDGEHPCSVCNAIKDGKKQEEKKTPLLQAELKKDYLAPCHRLQIRQEWGEVIYSGSTQQLEGMTIEPAVPPPRSA
jgi:hypothetical protein